MQEIKELSKSEEMLINTKAHEFIKMIETISMSKSYKIPVLLTFYNNGNIKMKINEDDVYNSFYEFYHKVSNKVDMLKHKSTANFEEGRKKENVKLSKNNPVNFLLKSESVCSRKIDDGLMALNEKMKKLAKDEVFVREVMDGGEYRRLRYYDERNF